MEWLYKYKYYLGVFLVVIIIGVVFFIQNQEDKINSNLSSILETPNPSPISTEELYVDIKGAVVHEGVYILEQGKRVNDAIEAAGGFLEEANKNQINLAQLLVDEMVIYVPTISETFSVIEVDDGKINLNTATQTQLETLPGIGPSKALAIIDYRTKHGPFKRIEELKEVEGIGEKTFEKLKDFLKI